MKPTGDEACSAIPSSHSLQGFDGLLPDRQPVHGIHALDHITYGVALYSRQILSLYVNQWNGVLAAAAARRVLRAGLLVRSSDWFKAIDMDANLGKTDSAVGIDLGQYVALTLEHDVESDIDVLLAEVRRLRAATRG